MVKGKSGGVKLEGSSELKSVVEYAKKAHEGNQSDAKIKEFYMTVKQEYEGGAAAEVAKEAPKEEKKEEVKRDPNEPVIVEETKSFAYTQGTTTTPSYINGGYQ